MLIALCFCIHWSNNWQIKICMKVLLDWLCLVIVVRQYYIRPGQRPVWFRPDGPNMSIANGQQAVDTMYTHHHNHRVERKSSFLWLPTTSTLSHCVVGSRPDGLDMSIANGQQAVDTMYTHHHNLRIERKSSFLWLPTTSTLSHCAVFRPDGLGMSIANGQ